MDKRKRAVRRGDLKTVFTESQLKHLLNKNVCIVGGRNTGKTTLLVRICGLYRMSHVPLVVMDSVTEHKHKSLIHALGINETTKWYTSPSVEKIKSAQELLRVANARNIQNEVADWYPELSRADFKRYEIVMFDVSKYLEDGLRAETKQLQQQNRRIYSCLVNQTLLKLVSLCLDEKSQMAIVTDEIEFSFLTFQILQRYSWSDSCLICAVHEYSKLGECRFFFRQIIHLRDAYPHRVADSRFSGH